MKRIPRIILLVIVLCLLCIPVAALAESDYEEGDGWIYRDGELKVITNNGLINFLYHEFDVRGDPQHKHTADDVDLRDDLGLFERGPEFFRTERFQPLVEFLQNASRRFVM